MACSHRSPSGRGAQACPAVIDPQEISRYWDVRAPSYSNGVRDEMAGFERRAWTQLLSERLASLGNLSDLHVLDLGCGPGFFSILLARLGCRVDAVDASEGMLGQAHANAVRAGVENEITFHKGDIKLTCFNDDSFDAIVSRNVTWLLDEPLQAYGEWHRLLVPGGKMIAFDANWYRYLIDAETDRKRTADQRDSSVLEWSADAVATSVEERACEQIALRLPLTYELRPSWDAAVLTDLGYSSVLTDESVWRRVWSRGEQLFYASSPLFMIEAVK